MCNMLIVFVPSSVVVLLFFIISMIFIPKVACTIHHIPNTHGNNKEYCSNSINSCCCCFRSKSTIMTTASVSFVQPQQYTSIGATTTTTTTTKNQRQQQEKTMTSLVSVSTDRINYNRYMMLRIGTGDYGWCGSTRSLLQQSRRSNNDNNKNLYQGDNYDDNERSGSNKNIDKGFNLLEMMSTTPSSKKNSMIPFGLLFPPKIPQGPIVTVASTSWNFLWKRFMTELAPQNKADGSYVRPKYTFQGSRTNNNIVTSLSNEPNRYHIYTGNPCPWCHRVVLTIQLLQIPISYTILQDDPYHATKGGWIFSKHRPDTIFGNCHDLYELYQLLEPNYTGRCTAPILVDIQTRTIVSNESLDIVRLLNQMMILRKRSSKNRNKDGSTPATTTTTTDDQKEEQEHLNLVPEHLKNEIEQTNQWIYHLLNNGVYRCGFATQQSSYERASHDVIKGLDRCEQLLTNHTYIIPSSTTITESDVLLLPTLLRFDCVYNPLFKAGGSYVHIQSHYPNIHRYIRTMYKQYYEPMNQSIDLSDACSSYYKQLFPLNPGGIIPTPLPTPKLLGFIDNDQK